MRKELKCSEEEKTGAGGRVVVGVKILGGVTERERVGNGNKSITIPKGNTTQRKLLFNCHRGLGTWFSTDFSRGLQKAANPISPRTSLLFSRSQMFPE